MAFDHDRRFERLEERLDMTEATVAELQGAVTTLTTSFNAFNAFAADTNQTIADLIAKEAAGGTITAADLGPIKDSIDALAQDVDAADVAVKGEDPGKPVAAPDKPVYVHDSEGSTESWTPSGFQVPATPEVPAVPANPETGAAEVPAQPAKPAVPLWYFNADAVGGPPTGAAEGQWTVYTGPTEPVPAA